MCPTVPLCETMLLVSPVVRSTTTPAMLPTPAKRTLPAARSIRAIARAAPRVCAHGAVDRLDDLGRVPTTDGALEDAHGLGGGVGRGRAMAQPVDHQDQVLAVALDRRPVVAADVLAGRGHPHDPSSSRRADRAARPRLGIDDGPRRSSRFRGRIDLEAVRQSADGTQARPRRTRRTSSRQPGISPTSLIPGPGSRASTSRCDVLVPVVKPVE